MNSLTAVSTVWTELTDKIKNCFEWIINYSLGLIFWLYQVLIIASVLLGMRCLTTLSNIWNEKVVMRY